MSFLLAFLKGLLAGPASPVIETVVTEAEVAVPPSPAQQPPLLMAVARPNPYLDMVRVKDCTAEFVGAFEGCVLHPYRDAVGVWTIGYGSTWGLDGKPVTGLHPLISATQARELLKRDLEVAAGAVTRHCHVTLHQGQFDALVSFTYNLGEGNLKSSTLLRKVNELDFKGAALEFPRWNKAGGKVLTGLVRRRAAEAALFSS